MSLRIFLRAIIFVLVMSSTAVFAVAQDHGSALEEESHVYPESADGLKLLIRDVFTAMQAKDDQRASSLLSNMAVPEHAAWFAKTFGPTEGSRIDTEYTNLLPDSRKRIAGVFELALKEGRIETRVAVVNKGNRTSEMEQRVVDAMQAPVPLYVAIGSTANDQTGTTLGHFFYVDGGFRFVTTYVLNRIGAPIPTRIRVAGNIEQTLLVKRVEPVHPPTNAKGMVSLVVIIATDGSVSEVSPLTGDPALTQAAIDAVRQWKYRPTTLNGRPMIVETTVTLEFKK
jgi:TonB family protein